MSHRRIITVATSLALVTAASLAVVQAAHAAVGCQVTYAVTAQWPGGFTGNITIRNIGDALTSWTLRWSFTAGQTVTQGWGGNFTQSGAQVTVTDAGWNGNQRPGRHRGVHRQRHPEHDRLLHHRAVAPVKSL